MEKKESTTSGHVGMCEKLFNVFNPASRSHHLLTPHGHGPEATINVPSATKPNHSLDSGIKEPGPQKALPTPVKPRPPAPDQKKPSEAIAPKAEPKPTTPPPSSVPVEKAPDKVVLTSARPKAATIPQPVPPQGAAAVAAEERPKKNINEKVEDYIKRAKERMRTISGVGRTPTS